MHKPGTERYRIRPALLVLAHGNGLLQIGVSPMRGVVIEQATDGFRALVYALRTGGTCAEVLAAVARVDPAANEVAIRRWIALLDGEGLLEDQDAEARGALALSEEMRARHSHTLALLGFFAQPGRVTAHEYLHRLMKAQVTVLGVGGVGCHVAQALAAAGVGSLHLIDGDRVDLTNLNRQILYRPTDVGRLKVEVAQEALAAMAPQCRLSTCAKQISCAADLQTAIPCDCTFLVCAGDEPYGVIYRWVNEFACAHGIPWVGANLVETLATIGPLVLPTQTACWKCMEAAMSRTGEDPWRLIDLMETNALHFGASPSLAPFVAYASGLLATDVVKAVTGVAPPATASRTISFDVADLTPHVIDWQHDANCPVCANGRPPPPARRPRSRRCPRLVGNACGQRDRGPR